MAHLNYKPGIKKFLAQMEVGSSLSKEALELLNEMVQNACNKLVNHCLDNLSDQMDETIARNAVDVIFDAELESLAFAEADRIMMLYSNGLVDYTPKRFAKKKKGKKAKAIASLEFSRGITDLTLIVFPESSLHEQSKEMLCGLLEELAVKVSDYVQSNNKKNISQENVRDAIARMLPQELSTHAIAEGTRMTFLFETGVLQETISKPEAVRKRKRVPSKETPSQTPKVQRRRKTSAKKVSERKKALRKPCRRSAVSRRRLPSKELERKVSRKKRAPRKKVIQRAPRAKVTRKRRAPKKVSRKKKTAKISQRAPSRKRRASAKKTSITRKKSAKVAPTTTKKTTIRKTAGRVSPKATRKISRKKKMVSEEKVAYKFTIASAKEINIGFAKLCKISRQKIHAGTSRMITDCLGKLLDHMAAEMRKSKYSVIGPQEISHIVKKVLPSQIAELAAVHLNRSLMDP